MNTANASLRASVRWMRRSRRVRRSLAGVAVVGLGWLVWQGLREDALPDFSVHAEITERKAAFFGYLLPQVQRVNAEILAERQRLLRIREELVKEGSAGWIDARWLRKLAGRYELELTGDPDVEFADRLLGRVDIIAPSLVLAQAANESAWGTSRFALQGNNLFGMRTYDGSGLVPHRRKPGRRFTVATYDSVRESIAAYVHNLNTHYRYRRLRQIRAELREQGRDVSGHELANGLGAYSTRGSAYIAVVQSMIRTNGLAEHDE
ncbi:MAG: glucosaminidase domain-containing protein [Opitutaceae bacterium]|nr:glucosaminidase domain-containing protein [Opitutaceae bacterium]